MNDAKLFKKLIYTETERKDEAVMTSPDEPIQSSFYYHKAQHNPDVQGISSMTLYEGPRVKKDIAYTVIKDRNTGEFHHDCVTFKTYRKSKNAPPHFDAKSSFTLSDDKNQELTQALTFIQACRGQHEFADGRHQLHPTSVEIREQIKDLNTDQQVQILLETLYQLQAQHNPQELLPPLQSLELSQLENTALLFHIALCRQVLGQLAHLLKSPPPSQSDLQQLLTTQPWLLGCDFAEKLDTRYYLPEVEPCFELYRSPTGQMLIFEIHTPLEPEQNLMEYHADADLFYPCPALNLALGQVQKYLSLLAPLEVQAQIIIGHSHQDPQQIEALRIFNSHLKNIVVMPFDQLLNTAKQVLVQKQNLIKQSWNHLG